MKSRLGAATFVAALVAAAISTVVRAPIALAAPGDCDTAPASIPTGLTNMGFETGALPPWRTGTVVDTVAVSGADSYTSPYEGNAMARLGSTGAGSQPPGPNEICQDFVVDSASESFVYNIFTHDYQGFDDFRFELKVTDPATGELLAAHQQGAWGSGTSLKSTGWKYVTLNLSDRIGQTVRLRFSAGGTSDSLYRFWAYLDSAESGPPPVVAPLADASSTTGSVMTDPQTGQVTIAMPFGNKSPITITTTPVCPPGTTLGSVTLFLGSNTFPMTETPPGSGTYSATIPAASVQSGTLSIQVVCSGSTFVNTIGTIQLYDPSGTVTDAATGLPVEGATVTLFKVPGWSAMTGPSDTGATKCQSNLSKNPGDPWNQPAPTTLGVEVNPVSNPEIDPDVNPFVTNSVGYYGWDVAAGCWYVVVSKAGYQTLTSPVVGVPPAVTDLNLVLTPIASDTTAPSVNGSASPAANAAGWHKASPTVLLSAADNQGGSGVASITYSATGAQPIASTTVTGDSASFAITVDGTTTITYSATDNQGNTSVPATLIVKLDTVAPSVSCSATPDQLWPPNNKMREVSTVVSVTDTGSGPAGFVLTSTSVNDGGDPATSIGGWSVGTADTSGSLRATRSGSDKAGRTYILRYTGSDAAENSTTCDAVVRVPHDMGSK